ncbi:MAG: tRNA lysidine(34) synthetase TilS [Saccharofermentanales bacterium]
MAAFCTNHTAALTGKVKNTILSHGLILSGDIVIAGVSGGADSMCMLRVLIDLASGMGFSIEVCHMDHSLRGRDSREDLEFVRLFCASRGIRFRSRTADVAAFAASSGRGTEEAARMLRYGFFNDCADGRNVRIAVAHHSQDQFETVLLNLIRGSGTAGLAGMKYISGNVIRPMLDCSPEDIAGYIAECGAEFRTDSSNFEPVNDRNRIRLELLPVLREHFDRNVIDSVVKSAGLCRTDDDFIRLTAGRIFEDSATGGGLPCETIARSHPAVASRLVRMLLERAKGDCRNLSLRQTEAILEFAGKYPRTGRIDISDGFCAAAADGYINVVPRAADSAAATGKRSRLYSTAEFPVSIPCDDVYEALHCEITIKTQEETDNLIENISDIVYNTMTWVMPKKYVEGSVWRHRRTGDRFRPNCGSGSKSIRKYLNESGVPPEDRGRLVFLAKGSEVLAILEMAAAFIPDVPDDSERIFISGRYRS